MSGRLYSNPVSRSAVDFGGLPSKILQKGSAIGNGSRSSALIKVSGPSYPSRRNVSAAASPAAPPPTMITDEGVLPLIFRIWGESFSRA